MTPKEIFSIYFYDALVEAVEKIPDETAKDVYICKLFIHNSGSGNEMASVGLQYNTNTALQNTEELSEEYWWGRMPYVGHNIFFCKGRIFFGNELRIK